MGIAILSSDSYSRFDIGATELRKAREAMKKLDKLNVTKDTYKRAEDAKSKWNWNWITGDDAHKEKIEKQTKLENDVKKNLLSIAAANVRDPGSVDPAIMKEARKLEEQWSEHLWDNYAKATDTDDYGLETYIAASDSYLLDDGLNRAKPDAISLKETKSFLDQVTTLHEKIDDARWVFESGALNDAERAKARKDVKKYWDEMMKKIDLVDTQSGRFSNGLTDIKINVLPEGDLLKTAYKNQDKALSDLEGLFRLSEADYEVVTQSERS